MTEPVTSGEVRNEAVPFFRPGQSYVDERLLRRQQLTERAAGFLLLACAIVSVLTTIGIVIVLLAQALEFFAWGSRSWVCGGSNFLPKEHIAFYEACVLEKDFDKGRAIMKALLPLMAVLEGGGKFVQCIKFGCELEGLRVGAVRPPLRPLNNEDKRSLQTVVANLKRTIAQITSGN